jgi:hypothetical protein
MLLAGAPAPVPGFRLPRRGHLLRGSDLLLSPATRPHALAQLQHLGVKALRVELYWSDVAPSPTSATRPKFEATNPASYNWGQYDALLAEAQRLHWQVLLTVTSPVPVGHVQRQSPLHHPPGRARLRRNS